MKVDRPTKVLFLAWGYSIHAKRHIEIFTNDPSFEIAVAATHDYGFENAENVLLPGFQMTSHEVLPHIEESRERVTALLESVGITEFSEIKGEIYRVIYDFQILEKTVQRFQPDVIFLQTLLYPCYLSYLLSESIPKVVTFWNGDVAWGAETRGIERYYKQLIVRRGAKTAAAVTINCQVAADACLDYGVSEEKINFIRYPGVDLDLFSPGEKNTARKKLNIDSQYVVLCPRGLGAYLNSDIIVEAAHLVCKEYPQALFLFVSGVGGKETWEEHMVRAKELDIEKNLRWDGQIPWEEMPDYYRAADLMLSVPSHDAFPNCMIEAMACGTPVMMGDLPQIREWISDKENGFLVPLRDYKTTAERIIETFQKDSLQEMITSNINLVYREVDAKEKAKQIKQLIHQIAKTERQTVGI